MRSGRAIAFGISACLIAVVTLLTVRHFRRNNAAQPIHAVQEEPARQAAGITYVKLAATQIPKLLDGDCSTISRSRELPDPIKNAFATLTRDRPFALADPGARFNTTDFIEEDLPMRRLVLAGHCEDRWFIEYEHGGIGLSIALMVLRVNHDQSVTLLWGTYLEEKATNLDKLRSKINKTVSYDEPADW